MERLRFDFQGVLEGAKQSWPIALGVFTYGVVFGILARGAGLDLLSAMSMSAFVFAGASQFVVLDLWGPELAVGTIIITTVAVNMRHVLMSAALQPWFSRLSPLQAYGCLFFMNDESWALTLGHLSRNGNNGAFLLGSGLLVFVSWLAATFLGRVAVSALADPSEWGLDFAFTAVFIALLIGLRRGRRDILPWLVAAGAAVAASQLLPGKWYILIGGLLGSLASVLVQGGSENE